MGGEAAGAGGRECLHSRCLCRSYRKTPRERDLFVFVCVFYLSIYIYIYIYVQYNISIIIQ